MNIKNYIYSKSLAARYRLIEKVKNETSDIRTRKQIESFQVDRFNIVWEKAWRAVPFYSEWKNSYSLPERIKSLEELNEWPILTKDDLRNSLKFERNDVLRPSGRILTGGSTGTPVRLPSWGDPMAGVNQAIGRARYGISLSDRIFLLWGHEHLYGKGFRRKINALKRGFKDWLANWKRVSAYDLSAGAMQRAYKVCARFKPKFVIGFSPAVLAFVRHNKDKVHAIDSVRVILCTAGPLTSEEKLEIEDFFGGTVCMEYGSVECGVMAYTRPKDGQYNVFWNTHLLQAQKQSDGEYKNLVTRLTDCYVPLIRYDIGDYLDVSHEQENDNVRSVLEIRSVKGRPSEMIKFKCGVSFFGALIGDCVKQVPEIVSSQMAVDETNNKLEIRVTASRKLDDSEKELIKNRLNMTVENMEGVEVQVVQFEKLLTTVGGKIPRIVRM